MITDAITTAMNVFQPSSAAMPNSGMRAIHGPTCGITSPRATMPASSSG